ncbi:MAG: hypothetical protein F4X83_10820, partial [Chloroflexi bacterium]|nr:hypothetical protein [Chloroflexota bacterium]
MSTTIVDRDALFAVSPAALSAYARSAGWLKVESFGDHSDVYDADGLPEIILPRTQNLGDYANVTSHLIRTFAKVAEMDEISLYRVLVTADRDVIRVHAASDHDGSVTVNEGMNLVRGAHDMLLAAACSLHNPRPIYRAGANKEATEYMSRVRLGQTEQGSFIVTLLSPVVPPPTQPPLFRDPDLDDAPLERRVTRRLAEALIATRKATEKTVGGDTDAFADAVDHGASANLCEALAQLVEPFPSLDVSLIWSRTLPQKTAQEAVRFNQDDAPILSEAARSYRNRAPIFDGRVCGFVQRLTRDVSEIDGSITLRVSIDEKTESVAAILNQDDYDLAIQAHQQKKEVVAEGDLERVGQRW